MARRSRESDPIVVNPTTFADYSAGMHLFQGVLLALLQRDKTGRGQQFNVSLLDSMIAAQTQEAATLMMRGSELNWGAMPLSGVFETSDGALVLVGAFKAHPVKDIGTALGIAGLEDDPRFTTHALRMENKPALQALLMERFKTNTTAHWIGKLEEQDLLCAPVHNLAEALADEQVIINGMIMEAPGVVETVKVVGSPIHMADAPVTIRVPPATLGQHTAEVLAELAQSRAAAAE
jgi:crotonobetainyl-CoA:carnitine CoA-transferase CaiB-like acyl-CoA transferase